MCRDFSKNIIYPFLIKYGRNIECTPSILYIYFFFGIFVSLYATCIIT